ncbi:hypothetical protein [Janthinobacterium tructae]|uniref:Uncharacterized protein n=1 Tax=Janthinobacterium tructae TaxID=2590869 RepID=A0A4Y6R934_9BURK|nr:hypothetical protein [Janthinobacterium tructae]QDG69379.1 hypothetical protein FJQ89_02330 [Janthinobacterium tructae]
MLSNYYFDIAKFGKCMAVAEPKSAHFGINIWHGPDDRRSKITYEITVTGGPAQNQIPFDAALEDAVRIAVGHFEQSSGSNHADFRFQCSPVTHRWQGIFARPLGG